MNYQSQLLWTWVLAIFAVLLIQFMAQSYFGMNRQGPQPLSLTEETGPDGDPEKQPGLFLPPLDKWVAKQQIDRLLSSNEGLSGVAIYNGPGIRQFTASASAEDSYHYLVNRFLVGFEPYRLDQIWEPWYAISQKKTYELDEITYSGRPEVWQTSRQAYYRTRGDCEDHALILADWLIEMGYDARVVLGKFEEEGHAWVVLFKDGKEYLLEATQKGPARNFRRYPLAFYQTAYRPEFMFNRTSFWANEGTLFTSNYDSANWVHKSELAASY